ncbi:MAG: homoserine dehydrogenase [Nitrosomonadales bacterium]|nr:homoserine dehydrogenase [Nitrosomonadales bacterium]
MEQQNIAIVGLGRVGSVFLSGVLLKADSGINLVCVAETGETPGKAQAVAANIRLVDIDQLIALGDELDIVFDLTGLPAVRRELRAKLAVSNNHHTVIATESVARLIWTFIGGDGMPVIEGRKTSY